MPRRSNDPVTVISGGFGFIGSWLTERLLREGKRVVVIDNLSSAPVPIDQLLMEYDRLGVPVGRLTFVRDDFHQWTPPDVMTIEGIYHLASPVGPAGILTHSGNIVHQVARDTYHAARIARTHAAPLVDVSTSEVYGGGQDGLCAEWMDKIIQPESTVRLEYAMAKLAMETALSNMSIEAGMRTGIVRPFNVAGPRQSGAGGFVTPRFILQAITNTPLTVFDGGHQVRAFTHVADIVDGLIRVMDYIKRNDAGEPHIFNIGNPANKTTILELAQMVIEETGTTAGIRHTTGRAVYGDRYAEAADKYPSAEKAAVLLGWEPEYSIRDIVRSMIAYAEGNLWVH